MVVILYILVGLFVGCLGALLGIGGGIFVVPLMTFVFGADPHQAVGTSLLVVLLNSLSGSIGYLKRRMVCMDAAWKFALATIPGAILGGYVSDKLSVDVLFLVFGIFFLIFSVYMFLKSNKVRKEDSEIMPEKYNWKLGTLCSTVVGFISSILGIGGGIIHVPMMTYLLKFPVKTAIATSTFILFVSATSGVISHYYLDHVLWIPALCIGSGALIGAQLGVRLAVYVKSSLLIKIMAILIALVGLKFLFEIMQPFQGLY